MTPAPAANDCDPRRVDAARATLRQAQGYLGGDPSEQQILEAARLTLHAQTIAPPCISQEIAQLTGPIQGAMQSVRQVARAQRAAANRQAASTLMGSLTGILNTLAAQQRSSAPQAAPAASMQQVPARGQWNGAQLPGLPSASVSGQASPGQAQAEVEQYFVYYKTDEWTCCRDSKTGETPHPIRLGKVSQWTADLVRLAGPFNTHEQAKAWTCNGRQINQAYAWISNWSKINGVLLSNLPCKATTP
jgi:hypothetical protein